MLHQHGLARKIHRRRTPDADRRDRHWPGRRDESPTLSPPLASASTIPYVSADAHRSRWHFPRVRTACSTPPDWLTRMPHDELVYDYRTQTLCHPLCSTPHNS